MAGLRAGCGWGVAWGRGGSISRAGGVEEPRLRSCWARGKAGRMHLGTPGESGGRWRQPCALRLPGPLTSAQHRVHVTAAAAGPLAVPHPWCLTAPVPCRPDKSASTCCATSSAGEESSPLRLQQHQHAAGDGRRLAPGAGVAGHGCTAAGAMRCAEHKKAGMSGCTLCQHVCLSSSRYLIG